MKKKKRRARPEMAGALRQWRSKVDFTQAAAALWLEVPLRTYQEWEQGRHVPGQPGPIRKLMALREEQEDESA